VAPRPQTVLTSRAGSALHDGNASPNIGSPFLDSARVASFCRTSQCSARRPPSILTISAAIKPTTLPHLARPALGARFTYRKIRHPASGYAVVGVAVGVRMQDGLVAEMAIGITGAANHAFSADVADRVPDGKAVIQRGDRGGDQARRRGNRIPRGPLRLGRVAREPCQDGNKARLACACGVRDATRRPLPAQDGAFSVERHGAGARNSVGEPGASTGK
jgi:hypothetical protein